jgi:hypothetical protein
MCPVQTVTHVSGRSFALRKPDAPSGFRRYETGRVGLYSSEFRKAWDSRAVGRSTRNRPKMMQELSRA